MKKPLPEVFVNQKARIEEHNRFMREARQRWGATVPICPDCYLPKLVNPRTMNCGCKRFD